ncbi:hypothetical protein GG344DRAFT_71410 [Lentinula edodes]|nr:hypothetical protein GG344DRAFT_71410 [Lentinula edodes]
MSSSPSKAPSAADPSRSSLPCLSSEGEVAFDGEVEQNQLAFTIELPSIPQLQLFENVFNTGKSLAAYCRDDPLWSTLAAVALPCSNCTKHPETCKVPEGSPRRRFLETHGTPAQRVSWTIPEDVWRRYDELLHLSTSATKVLVELNMLDEQDSRAIDRSELRHFQEAQEQETLLAAKRKRVNAPPSCKVRPKKRRLAKVVEERRVEEPVVEEVPQLIRLVVLPSRLAPSDPGSAPSGSKHSSFSLRLANLVDQQTGSQAEASTRSLGPGFSSIKASREDPIVPKMSPVVHPPLIPRILSQHPYRVENERLAARVRLLESQLASSRQENATLTSALRDTSVSLEARQGELDQLRESVSVKSMPRASIPPLGTPKIHLLLTTRITPSNTLWLWHGYTVYMILTVSSAAQQQELHDRLLDQVETLKRALPGPPNESLVDRFRALEEDLRLARESRANSATILGGRVQCSGRSAAEENQSLQEEVHRFRERALFAEKMIREYPEEGSYSVSLPPLSEVHGELNEALASLRHVTTFAHRLFRCDPASVLHQHNRYVGVIIDAVISFLRRGLDTLDKDVLALNLQLALHIQWFFANAAEREEGIYRLVLAHSRFSDDAPFLNVAQHAGFIAPFSDSLEPPLHCRMFALETALPHHGAGNWEDLVPAVPSLDTLMQEWEAMMSSYIRFVTKPPSPQRDPQGEDSAHHEEVSSLQERGGGGQKKGSVRPEEVSALQEGEGGVTAAIPLFLPEPLSPTPVASAASPPSLPPRFGSVANLVIDMTADKDDDDIYESPGSIKLSYACNSPNMLPGPARSGRTSD